MTDDFVGQWRTLLATPNAKSEVDASHPLRFIYGSNELGQPLLFVICDDKPALPELSEVVEVMRGIRSADEKWTLSMTLRDEAYLDVFFIFASDVVDRTASSVTERRAIKRLMVVLGEWKRLFEESRGVLSRSEIRGAVGEMLFGLRVLAASYDLGQVVRCWGGPMKADQDYTFGDGGIFEVKTVYHAARNVRIASAEQLDINSMTLAVVTLDDATPSESGAFSLNALIAEFRAALDSFPEALTHFMVRLRLLRIDAAGVIDDATFVLKSIEQFRVADGFPRLRRRDLPNGVASVEYQLSRALLTPYLFDSTTYPSGETQ